MQRQPPYNDRPKRIRFASRRAREASAIAYHEKPTMQRPLAPSLAPSSEDVNLHNTQRSCHPPPEGESSSVSSAKKFSESTSTNVDSSGHGRIRTQSQKAREVEMQNDDLKRRFTTIAPAASSHPVSNLHPIPRFPAIAPRLPITPTTPASKAVHPLPRLRPLATRFPAIASPPVPQALSTMHPLPRLWALAPRGCVSVDDTSFSPVLTAPEPLSTMESVQQFPVLPSTGGHAPHDTEIEPPSTSDSLSSVDGIPRLPVLAPMGGPIFDRSVSGVYRAVACVPLQVAYIFCS